MFLIVGLVGAFLGFGVLMLIQFTENKDLTWAGHYLPATCITLGFGTFGLLMGLLMELPGKWIRTTIEADREGIRVVRRGLIHRGEEAVAAADIREVTPSIVTRDRTIPLQIGDVRVTELEWLRDALCAVLMS